MDEGGADKDHLIMDGGEREPLLLHSTSPPPYSASALPSQSPLINSASPNSPPADIRKGHTGTATVSSRIAAKLTRAYTWRSLFAVKPIEAFLVEREARPEGHSLAERLGLVDLLGYGVGCTVGAGIYSLIGIGVGIAGPGVMLSFLIGGIASMFTALAYSEFAARVPVTGSAYTFAYVSFGEFLAWIIGWNLTLEYCISSAAIARSWGDYFAYLWTQWGLDPPYWLNDIPCGITKASPAAAVIIILCTIVMVFGITTSSTFNVIITILNVGVLIFFIGVGSCRLDPSNWVAEDHSFFPEGAGSVFQAAGTVFFAYLGFDMVSSLAEETKNPTRNVPLGIIGSLAIAATIYVLVSLVSTGLVPPEELANSQAPLAYALEQVGLNWAGKVITVGSLLGLTTATFTGLLGQPRIFYTMARDGLLFPIFHWTVKRFDVPVIGTIITGVFTAGVAFFMTLEALTDAISIGTLIAFSIVCAGVMILRYSGGPRNYIPVTMVISFCCLTFVSAMFFVHKDKMPYPVGYIVTGTLGGVALAVCVGLFFMRSYDIPKSFKCPLVPFVPCLGISINMYMLAGLKSAAWIRLGVWVVIGVVIYFAYGIWSSKMRNGIARPMGQQQPYIGNADMEPDKSQSIQTAKKSI